MLYWISRFSKIFALIVFFILFFAGSNPDNFFGETFFPALLKAFAGATLFWVFGFVIGDIVLKGAVEDVPKDSIDVLDGGIVQRLYETKTSSPFGKEEKEQNEEKEQDSKSKDSKKSK